jgi:parallel beta-helix repeat protein
MLWGVSLTPTCKDSSFLLRSHPLFAGLGVFLKINCFILIIFSILGATYAEIATVCPSGCDYASIAAGINVAHPGDTVEVHSGTYLENLIIKKPMILKGMDTGNGRPIVDANRNGSGIMLAANGITLTGFKINHSLGSWLDLWAGIIVTSNDSTIADNVVVGNENGILIKGSSNNTLNGNVAINNGYGIKLINSQNNTIENNIISNNFYNQFHVTYGLLLLDSHNNIISNNEITGNCYGLLLNSSMGNNLRNNIMNDNGCNFGAGRDNDIDVTNIVDNKSIYFLKGAIDSSLGPSSNAGNVYCFDCRNIILKGLTLKNNLYGIYLCNTTQSTIENNSLMNNSYGLKMDESSNNSIICNEIDSNRIDGISLCASGRNDVESNIAKYNDNHGISLVGSAENNITNNSAVNNSNGMELNKSLKNKIAHNDLSANKNFGMLVFKSGWNNISYNNFGSNPIGLALRISWNNSIVWNLINNNTRGLQVISSSDNVLSDNTISDNKIILSRDFTSNNMFLDPVIISKRNEELIMPDHTGSPTGNYLPEIVKIEIGSDPAGASIILKEKRIGFTNRTTNVTEDDDYYNIELIWVDESYNKSIYINKSFVPFNELTKKGKSVIIRRENA